MSTLTMILLTVLLSCAVYQCFNIFISDPVDAHFAGYHESSYFDSEIGMEMSNYTPLYSYEYNGSYHTYKPMFCLPTAFARKERQTLYVRSDGKAFSLGSAAVCLALAAITLFVL